MKKEFINFEIFMTNDGSLQVSCPKLNIYRIWSSTVLRDNNEIKNFFDFIANQEILSCYEKDNNRILCTLNDEKINCRFVIKNYNRLFYICKFDKLDKKMYQYWFKRAAKNIQKNMNAKIESIMGKLPVQFFIAGSLVTSVFVLPPIIGPQNNDTTYEQVSTSINEETVLEQHLNELTEIVINNEDLNIPSSSSEQETIQIQELVIDDNDLAISKNNEYESLNNTIIEQSPTNETNNIDIIETLNIEHVQNHFSKLSSFTSPMEYINFAANLYGVDKEVANELLKDKIGHMEEYINESNDAELKNFYALKQNGIINGDLDIIGIFVIIKNYAINNLDLANQEPIISNKTASEKEQDLMDIARYIYGIENKEILDIIITIHRLETDYGRSSYAVELNNFGGNMNANPSQEQINRFIRIIKPEKINIDENPIPNIYKTAEIGEESMIRNFLNVYAKCLRDNECINKNSLAGFLSTKYCTHTPEAWEQTINEMLNDGTIQETVESYINNNSKTL